MRALTICAIVLVAVTAASLRPAHAEPVASRIIDRTLSCSVAARAGVRAVEVGATTGTRLLEDRSKWKFLASAGVGDSMGSFAGVSAGNPLADLEPGFPAPPFRLYLEPGRRCKPAPRIPFSTKRLTGEEASPLGSQYACRPGRRVVVRVRGEFLAPTSLRQRRFAGGVAQLVASGTVAEGQLAVRSAAGKPLAYAQVLASGKARIFTAKGCVAG